MNIKFEVLIKEENKIVHPIGYFINEFGNETIIRLYIKCKNGMVSGIPYRLNEIEIKKLEIEN